MPHASSAPISVPISAAAARPPPSRASCIPFAICFPFVATPRSHTCRRPARLVRLAQPVTFVPPPSAPPPLPSRAAPRRRARPSHRRELAERLQRRPIRTPRAQRPAPRSSRSSHKRAARERAGPARSVRARVSGLCHSKDTPKLFRAARRASNLPSVRPPASSLVRRSRRWVRPHNLTDGMRQLRRSESPTQEDLLMSRLSQSARAEQSTCFRSSVRARLCPRPQARAQAPARTPSRVQPCAARASRSRRARSRCWRGARRTRARGAVRRQPRVPLPGAGAGRQGAVPGGVVELDVVLQCPRAVVEAARWWYQAPQTAASRAEEVELAEARHA